MLLIVCGINEKTFSAAQERCWMLNTQLQATFSKKVSRAATERPPRWHCARASATSAMCRSPFDSPRSTPIPVLVNKTVQHWIITTEESRATTQMLCASKTRGPQQGGQR